MPVHSLMRLVTWLNAASTAVVSQAASVRRPRGASCSHTASKPRSSASRAKSNRSRRVYWPARLLIETPTISSSFKARSSSHSRPGALLELGPANFAVERLGQRVQELDLPRVHVGCGLLANDALQLGLENLRRLEAIPQHHVGLNDGGPDALRVGRAHAGRLGHGRMPAQRLLHLHRRDVVAGRHDHLVGPPDVADVAVLVHADDVRHDGPAVADGVALLL